jgi:hypothetical protein
MRILTSMLALGTLAMLVAGCGSSGSSTTAGSQRSDQAGSGSEISKARAVAYAHAVNLTATDVPGAVVRSQERESGAPSLQSVQFARCAGAVNPDGRVVDVKSAIFRIGQGTEPTRLKSSVEVMPSAALAAQDYAAARSSRGQACLARLLPQVLEGTTARVADFGPATASFLPNLLPAGQASFGVRVITSLTAIVAGKQTRLPVYLDIFEILAGPAEVSLTATSVSQPASSATERRLLSLLCTRAQAHKL